MIASPTAEAARERLAGLTDPGRMYSSREIGQLDEATLNGMLALYQLRGEHDLAGEIELELEQRAAETEQEAHHEHAQAMHDEWLNDYLAEDGRWG